MTAAILILLAYLLGSIPFGLLIGFARGVDIRKVGSGNIGATNAGRQLGKVWGRLVLACDILKGLIPTLVAGSFLATDPPTAAGLGTWIAVAAAAVVGHIFPIYLGFRGGKGVATTIGVALGIWPYFTIPMVIALLAFAVLRFGTGKVSPGSLGLAVAFPLAVWGYLSWSQTPMQAGWPALATSVVLGLLILIRHRTNIVRLWQGTET